MDTYKSHIIKCPGRRCFCFGPGYPCDRESSSKRKAARLARRRLKTDDRKTFRRHALPR
jgi:hypothetical protein